LFGGKAFTNPAASWPAADQGVANPHKSTNPAGDEIGALPFVVFLVNTDTLLIGTGNGRINCI
jgi:hypothetical protein